MSFSLLALSLLDHLEAIHVRARTAIEISLNQIPVRERVHREAKPVALGTDAAEHFVVRPQVRVLVVLDPRHLPGALLADVARQVTRRARDTGPLLGLARPLEGPQPCVA